MQLECPQPRNQQSRSLSQRLVHLDFQVPSEEHFAKHRVQNREVNLVVAEGEGLALELEHCQDASKILDVYQMAHEILSNPQFRDKHSTLSPPASGPDPLFEGLTPMPVNEKLHLRERRNSCSSFRQFPSL